MASKIRPARHTNDNLEEAYDINKSMHRVILQFPRSIMTGLLLGFLATTTQAAGTLQPFEADNPEVNFSLTDLKGTTRTLNEYRGKVVLVNFWASWCVPCIKEMPGMQRIADALRDRPFVILAINIAEPQRRIQKFLKSMDINFKVLLDKDGSTFKAWQGRVLPTSFLLDPEGKIRFRAVGPIDWDTDEALATINKMMPDQQ